MSPLSKRTIATVGSGVMAEAMIAGLLRGELVAPGRVVASHPRAERREELSRLYGIRTVSGNAEAVKEADVILLAIKPQMLARVGRELRPHLQRRPARPIGDRGRDDDRARGVPRPSPDRPEHAQHAGPAGSGDDRLVRDAGDDRRAARPGGALLRALGAELEVDDEKFVAMATAVSGTGPTYVFLVMEALIDAAVHLGFPRHVAHDLVVETLEGSTLFAKQSGDHPAVLRNMVTSPGGTSAAALHELESGRLRTVLSEAVWAAYRRTVELGDQLEASVDDPTEAAATGAASPDRASSPKARAARPGGSLPKRPPAGKRR